ncbi:hypothetical protein SEA_VALENTINIPUFF_38 [Microbacterium phage ValentiniPuff]|uniref:Uncharacterized protein n=1 Tax=Microbacterium phage ValentiniPuff TaxID=2315705 RepID=A0A386KQU6_9CAUD|nr:hypothetical protein SEA_VALENTINIPUFF_38 [Microbacterium phage ValentiniPuff]
MADTTPDTPADTTPPLDTGIYLDRMGNVWRKWNDGTFVMLTHPTQPVSPHYAPWQKLVAANEVRAAVYGQQISSAEVGRLRGIIEDALPMLGTFRAYDVSQAQIDNLHRLLSRGIPAETHD